MAVQSLLVKSAATPVLIGGASLAGRRYGHQVGGWLVGLPLTSGPAAFFLATEHGRSFAAAAAVGMLAGTISQIASAIAYRAAAPHGWRRACLTGCVAFAAATTALVFLHTNAFATCALVLAAIAAGFIIAPRRRPTRIAQTHPAPRWDVPIRMLLATTMMMLITELAPVLGAHLAGLLSPFPVFGAVLAIFTHHTQGPAGASGVLDGFLLGLLAPTIFFLILTLTLPALGALAFLLATATALGTQALTMLALPRTT
jgi:hypothetical protein